MTYRIILVFFCLAVSAELQASDRSSEWALMNIKLGMSEAELRTLMPNAECERFADDTTSLCTDKDRKLAGEAAVLTARLLEGRVIMVAIQDISIAQALTGIEALKTKYGSADRSFKTRADLNKADNDCGFCLYNYSAWVDGNVEMFLNVNDWYSKKRDYNYSSIILQDSPAHNGKWVPKYDNKAAATEI